MLNPASPESTALQRGGRVLAAMSVVLAGAGLYVLGEQPFAVGLFPPPWDKLAHVATFALVGAATGLACDTRGWRLVLCCITGSLAIGIMDEAHQASLPGRFASWSDLGADAVGGLLGAALLGTARRLMRRQTPTHR